MNLLTPPRRYVFKLIAGALVLAGCGVAGTALAQKALERPTDPKMIAAAKKDGSLTIYGASSAASLKADAAAFQKAYGISARYTQMTSGPMAARVDQEIKAGRINADVIISADTTTLYRWVAAGEIGKLPDVKFPDRTEHLAPIQTIYQSLFYNTSAVAKADIPKQWNDVLHPRFAGKIVMGTPRIGPAYAMQYYALLKDPKYGEAFFQKLAAQRPRIVATPALVANLTASGEASIAFNGIPYDAANIVMANPKAPIAYTYIDPITTARTYVGINAKAQKPDAARLFAAWLMSPEGQQVHNGENRASSLLGNLPGTLAAPDQKRVRNDLTVNKVTMEYQTVISLFDRLFK